VPNQALEIAQTEPNSQALQSATRRRDELARALLGCSSLRAGASSMASVPANRSRTRRLSA
jgi:hypothetical protein